MSRVHITLVGGQPMPIYNGIRYSKPDKVVFVYSSQSRMIVERLLPFIECETVDFPPLDDNEPHAILKRASEIYAQFKTEDISLNISGGLKSWSHIFGMYFNDKVNVSIFYIDQNNTIMDLKALKSHQLECSPLSAIAYLKLYGNTLATYKNLSEYTEDDIAAISTIRQARKFCPAGFNELTIGLHGPDKDIINRSNGEIYKCHGAITWTTDADENKTDLTITLYNNFGSKKEFKIICRHAKNLVFNSGWFEIFVAKKFAGWSHSKEVLTNCIFKYDKGQAKNEIDIIVNLGNKLLFAECKTQIFNNTDLDKFISVVKTMSGTASKAIFITESKMRAETIAKCKENGIIHFSFADGKEQDLFRLLDNEYNKLNK